MVGKVNQRFDVAMVSLSRRRFERVSILQFRTLTCSPYSVRFNSLPVIHSDCVIERCHVSSWCDPHVRRNLHVLFSTECRQLVSAGANTATRYPSSCDGGARIWESAS